MSGSYTRWVGGGLLLVLIGAAGVLSGVDSGTPGLPGSANSSQPDGRRAALLALRELGFEAAPFERPPGDLPRQAALLWLARRPELTAEARVAANPDRLEPRPESDLDAQPSAGSQLLARSRHGGRYYRRFVDEGGVLVVPARDDVLQWLVSELDIARLREPGAAELDGEASQPPRSAWLAGAKLPVEAVVMPHATRSGGVTPSSRDAQRFDVRWGQQRTLNRAELAPDEILLELETGEALGCRLEVGRGAVVLLPDFDFVANGALAAADNALVFVRLVEALTPSRRVLFDEYAAGAWLPETPLEVAFSPRLRPLAWHVTLLGLLALWCAAWAREFPRDPRSIEPFSALARARASASLARRAARRPASRSGIPRAAPPADPAA